jgi:alpha-aminoadipate carrier protein LysW
MMKKRGISNKMTNCPECDAVMKIPDDAVEGEIVTCAECGASFELVKTSEGFDLKPAQTVGEDWGQ